MRPSMAALTRQKAQAEQGLDAARAAGDEEGFRDYFKRLAIHDDQIAFYPHLADRWVDEVIAGGGDLDAIRDRLQATMQMMMQWRLDALARRDHPAAERAVEAIDALKRRLAALLH